MSSSVTHIRIPGKINLWLEVLRRRSDGYHDISSLMVPVSIFDDVGVSLVQSGIHLYCDTPGVPKDRRNLAWLAASRYLETTGWQTGVQIHLHKSIPVAAGMGGGSANAAATIMALNRLNPCPLDDASLYNLARSLGADVPFFLRPRPQLAWGVGDLLEEIHGLPTFWLVLVKPPFHVSTPWVYGRIKLTRGEPRIRIASLLEWPWKLASVLENDLETPVQAVHPEIGEIKRRLLQEGAVATLMTGSGPTVFAVFREKAQARRVASRLREQWSQYWIASARTLSGCE